MLKPYILMLAVAGCAGASVTPLPQDTGQLSSAPACGVAGAAQRVSFQRTAAEAVEHGCDRLVIFGGDGESEARVLDTHTTAFGNIATAIASCTTTVTGGVPIVAHAHNQDLIVKMFKQGDPAGANTLDARQQLGPGWQEAV